MQGINFLRANELGVTEAEIQSKDALAKGSEIEARKATNGLEKFSGKSDLGPDWNAYLEELREVDDG